MRCKPKATGEIHRSGREIVRCERQGCTMYGVMPPSGNPADLRMECTGLPELGNWREWLLVFCEGVPGLTEAERACRFIRWRFRGSRLEELPKELPPPVLPPFNAGPGTELHKLLSELCIKPDASCGCAAMQAKMDAWGPAGCREHEAEIFEHLTAAYKSTDWPTALTAGTRALRLGYPLTLRGLLELAIERSELATRDQSG